MHEDYRRSPSPLPSRSTRPPLPRSRSRSPPQPPPRAIADSQRSPATVSDDRRAPSHADRSPVRGGKIRDGGAWDRREDSDAQQPLRVGRETERNTRGGREREKREDRSENLDMRIDDRGRSQSVPITADDAADIDAAAMAAMMGFAGFDTTKVRFASVIMQRCFQLTYLCVCSKNTCKKTFQDLK